MTPVLWIGGALAMAVVAQCCILVGIGIGRRDVEDLAAAARQDREDAERLLEEARDARCDARALFVERLHALPHERPRDRRSPRPEVLS